MPAAANRPAVHPLLAQVTLVCLLALVLTGPIMTFDQVSVAGEGNLFRQLGYVAITIMAALSVRGERRFRRMAHAVPWPLVAALAFCWLSVVWSMVPEIALRRVILTTLVVWSVFVLVRGLGYERSLLVLRVSLVVTLIANFLAVKLDPSLGIHQFDLLGEDSLYQDWRGVMAHKNIAGLVCALAVLYFAFDAGKIPVLVRLSVIGAAGYFLFYSSSRTSIGVCIAALAVGFVFAKYKYKYRTFVSGFLIAAIAAGAVVQNVYSDPFLRTMHDPDAFSGRTLIWQGMWSFYTQHPLLGAGFGSFWNIGPSGYMSSYSIDWIRTVTQGHNGFFDLLVQIGPIGLALVLFATVVVPLAKVLHSREIQGQTGALLMALLVFMIGHNMTESSLFDRDSIGQVFFMLTLGLLWTAIETRKSATTSSDLLVWANRAIAKEANVRSARTAD
ncbi:MAG TPA: O-antigen ligase family protein [Novosphingobium sp.]|nr:O-antigen ligase family protein [Novosphingobium sp.]